MLLQANVLMARGRLRRARSGCSTRSPRARARRSYVRYNLGVALVTQRRPGARHALLDAVGKLPAHERGVPQPARQGQRGARLRRAAGRPRRAARGYLERVRLSGMQSNKALLGFGWAAAAQGSMKSALVPWSELAGARRAATPPCSKPASPCPTRSPSSAPMRRRSSCTRTPSPPSTARARNLDDRSPRSATASCSTA